MITNTAEMAKMTMDMVRFMGESLILTDNKEGMDLDPEPGSIVFKNLPQDFAEMSGSLKYDELPDKMKQLRQMSLHAVNENGDMDINYGRVPDSSTEMVSIKSKAANNEIAVIVDEQKGVYEYHERPLGAGR
jgi:hypothetical protein